MLDFGALDARPVNGAGGLREALDRGAVSARALAEAALERIADPEGQGRATFSRVFTETALAEADAADRQLAAGERGPLLGIPVSIKDLFDVAGHPTTAGSRVLEHGPLAARDAVAVERLRRAGAVIIGRTTMTEFAFSGLGLNPHQGTPRNPWDRTTGRIPGGSSSGAAVSLCDGMSVLAFGSDTGGSVRIPSALCGLVGFKPTQAAVPMEGVFPLSTTLDVIGPLARSVADARAAFGIIRGREVPAPATPDAPRLLAPINLVLDGIDEIVAHRFAAALDGLEQAGWRIERRPFEALGLTSDFGRIGTFPALEAWAAHRDRIAVRGAEYDPRVRVRMEAAREAAPDARERLIAARQAFIAAADSELEGFDAFVMPTVPVVAPPLRGLEDDDEYARLNLLMLRNPTLVNLLDGCGVSLPVHEEGSAPVGLSLATTHGRDAEILALAAEAEALLAKRGQRSRQTSGNQGGVSDER